MRKPLMTSRLFSTLCAAVLLCGLPSTVARAQDDVGRECIEQLSDPGVDRITCDVPFQLERRTRDDLMQITGGVIRDAGCLLSVGVERVTVFDALIHAQDLTVPAQPVECDVETNRQPMRARFTLAPKVWFADGKAVRATPGVANVSGLPPILAILLTNWVNSDPQVQQAIVGWVNDYLAGASQ